MRIDTSGITPTSLEEYVTELEEAFVAAFGPAINLAPETPQGQFIGIDALARTLADEVVVAVAQGLNLHTAFGHQLDSLGSLMLLPRIAGERSIVTVTLTGTANTVVEKGKRASTGDGAVFALDDDATIGSGGTVDATMRSVDLGPIAAPAGKLTQIVDAVTGWTAVTNAAAAQLGRAKESDIDYRSRYTREVSHNGRYGTEHVLATVLAVEGVTDALVRDNDTNASVTTQGIAIGAGSLLVVVEGGANSDIGEAILRSKAAGVPTVGNVSVSVPHAQGRTTTVRFRRVDEVALAVSINITTDATFSTNGVGLIKERLVAWFDGTFAALTGRFETRGVHIGETVDARRLLTPIQSVPGHMVTSDPALTIQSSGAALPTTPNLDQLYTLSEEHITVNVS